MSIGKKVIQAVYELKDRVSGSEGKITGAFRKVDKASDTSADKLEKNNKRAAKSFGVIGRAASRVKLVVAGIFAAAGAAAVKATQDTIDYADSLSKLQSRLGIAPKAMSQLDYAASKSNVSFETLTTGVQRMTRRIAEAAAGTGTAKGALEELNLSAEHLNTLSPDEQFLAIAEALSHVKTRGDKVRLGMKLFDTEGVKLIQTMDGGAQGIRLLMEEADQLGKTVSSDTAQQAAQFNDRLTELKASAEGLGRALAVDALPALTRFMDQIAIEINGPRNYFEELKEGITETEREITRLKGSIFGVRGAFKGDDEIQQVNQAIKEQMLKLGALQNQAESLRSSEEEGKRLKEELATAEAEYTRIVEKEKKEQEKAVKESLKEQEKAHKAHLEKLRQHNTEYQAISEEFQTLVDEMRSDKSKEKTEDFDLIDLSAPISAGQRALASGDFDGAVEGATKAAEMLRLMKEEGNYADIVLTGMAMKIKSLAEKAADGPIQLIDPDEEKQRIAEIEWSAKDAMLSPEVDNKKLDDSIKEAVDSVPEDKRKVTFGMDADHKGAIKSADAAVAFADYMVNSEGDGRKVVFEMKADHQAAIDTAMDAVALADRMVNNGDEGREVTFGVNADQQRAIESAKDAIAAAQQYADQHPVQISVVSGQAANSDIGREVRRRGNRSRL
ncbi:MAG: hypothetical protein RPU59_07770 [Candidatus Sedimenticola sp. (ex Thyasira tokunagai)]